MVDYIVKEDTIVLKTSLGNNNIVLSDEEKNNYEMFSSYLEETGSLPVFEYTTMPEYRIVDNKSNIEIVTRGIVTCGACPVTQVYYQKYHLSDDGFDEKECWFESGNPLLADEYGF